jgi:hypothetical protein
MLTINTFKLFCLKTNTQKANEIYKYYLKLEEILHETVLDETNELKLQLEQKDHEILENKKELKQKDNEILENKDELKQKDNELLKTKSEIFKQNYNLQIKNNEILKNKEENLKLRIEKELHKQNMLLNEYNKIVSLVYIIKVKTYENGSYVVKIGESRCGIIGRFNEHKSNYDEILLLDCFPVYRSKHFESFLHNHVDIKYNKVTDLNGHTNEKELFLIGKNLSYLMLLNIINDNKKLHDDFNNNELENTKLELEKTKLKLKNTKLISKMNENNINKNSMNENSINIFMQKIIITNNKILMDYIEKSNKELLEKVNLTKTITNFNEPLSTIGPRLQKINPETLQLVKVYETSSECIKEDNKIKRTSLNNAILENTIYNGFRWIFVDRELDPNIIYNIEPTKQIKTKNLGYIAKLNIEKTEIINIYLNRKVACKYNNYIHQSALDRAVKNFTVSKNNFYLLFNNCDDKLKDDFITKYKEPLLYKNGIGQYDINDNLITEYICKFECTKILRMSDKTLAKALDKKILYNNHYYKYIGSKLKML